MTRGINWVFFEEMNLALACVRALTAVIMDGQMLDTRV